MEEVSAVTGICAYPVPLLGQLSRERGLGPVRNAILVTVALLSHDIGVVIGTVTRLGCVWEEILVTVDGFGAAIWKRCAQ